MVEFTVDKLSSAEVDRLRGVFGPLTYAAVETLDLPAWRARKIAQSTRTLSQEAAAFVDQHLAGVAHAVSYAQLERLIEEARVRFDPDAAEALRIKKAETRHVTIDTHQVSFDGHVDMRATLDLADAMGARLIENLDILVRL